MNGRLEEFGAPRLLSMQHAQAWHVNPEFVSWWRENKERVLAGIAK